MKLPLKKTASALTEQQVLDSLGIPDFRHLSKDKVMSFCSMIPQMDPEVAKAAIAQFPEFAKTMKEVLSDYQGTLADALRNDTENAKPFNDACTKMIDALTILLEKDDLSFEEKQMVIDQMQSIINQMDKKDNEHKKLVEKVIIGGCIAVVTFVGGAVAVLGGNAEFELPKLNK